MKKLLTSIALLAIASLYPITSNAQLLKNIINSVKIPGQNKSNQNNKKSDTTHAKGGSGDSSANALAMKFLGKLGQANAVSPADSASAIAGFKKGGSGGSGIHYQYLTTGSGKQKNTIQDTMNTYITNSGQGRSEMNLAGMMAAAMGGGVKIGSPLVVISNAAQRKYSVFLDADNKLYSLNIIDTALINSGHENYQVTKIGNETIRGYNCTHAKLTSSFGRGITKSTTTMDIWTCPDVPGYAMLKKWMSAQNVTPKMMQALDQAGCGGFLVKMSTQAKEFSYTMELIKADQNSFPASMFKIPAGYTQSKYNLMMANMMQAGMQAKQKK
jgi:L-rhamnose mutarotase